MADIYKMDTDYLSAESVYDRTLGKKQSEINNTLYDIETGTITTETYGTLTYAYYPNLHIVWLAWNGNGTAPSAGSKSFTVPAKLGSRKILTTNIYNGGFLQVNGTAVTLSLTTATWSAGYLCYPTV